MTDSEETNLKKLVKTKLFHQHKYINAHLWRKGNVQKKIMEKIELTGGNKDVQDMWSREVQTRIPYHLTQHRHCRVSAIYSMYSKGAFILCIVACCFILFSF